MTDTPERIWATGNNETGSWNATESRLKLHMPDCWQTEYVRADLAAPMRCAECDCEKGGADCNWIATPTPLEDPRVKALVEAANGVVNEYYNQVHGPVIYNIKNLDAALEAIASPSIPALEENK